MILRMPKYEVIPIYANKNLIKIKLDCIFSVHLMQYIYIIISKKIKEFWKNSIMKTNTFQNKKMEV